MKFFIGLILLSVVAFPTHAQVKLSVAYVPNIAFAQLMVIKGEGYDKEVGLDLELKRHPGAQISIQDYAQGNIDLLYTITSPLLTGTAAGIESRIVAGCINNTSRLYGSGLYAELSEKSNPVLAIREFKEQTGKKPEFAAFFRGNMTDVVLRYWLSENGIKKDEVSITNFAGQEQFQQGILSGKFDSILFFEPLISVAKNKGLPIEFLVGPDDLMENHAICVLAVHPDFLREKREDLKKFLKLHIRATEFIKFHPEQAAKHVYTYTAQGLLDESLIEEVLKREKDIFVHDPHAVKTSLQQIHDVMREQEILRQDVDVNSLFDTELYDEVIADKGEK